MPDAPLCDLGRLLTLSKPVVVRVRYELEQVSGYPLADLLRPVIGLVRRQPAIT